MTDPLTLTVLLLRSPPACDTSETPRRHPGPVGNHPADQDWSRIWDLVPSPEERLERLLARMRAGQKTPAEQEPRHRRGPGPTPDPSTLRR